MTTKPSATNSGTPQGTGGGNSVSFDDILAQLAKSGGAGSATEGPTRADAAAVVQSVYQQMLGRSAVGTELNQAISRYMSNQGDTGGRGNVQQFVMSTNEYQAQNENRYLDAIYEKLSADARGAQV